MKQVDFINRQENVKFKKINILRYKPFYQLIIPNFLRGFVSGIIQLVVTIGYYIKLLDSSSASLVIMLTQLVTIGGCFAYSYMQGRIRERNFILFSSVGVRVFMPAMLIGYNTVLFIIFYSITYFFLIIENYSVPAAVTKIVDYDVIGQYSAGRILINTGSVALGGFLCMAIFELFGVVLTLAITGIMQLVCGIWYYVYLNKI